MSKSADWKKIDLRPSNTATYEKEAPQLQLKTNTDQGTTERLTIQFTSYRGWQYPAGGITVEFEPPRYQLIKCTSSYSDFPTDLPSVTEKVWTIFQSRTADVPQIWVFCNDVEMLNIMLSEDTCSVDDWTKEWKRDASKTIISSDSDTASDYIRKGIVIHQLILARQMIPCCVYVIP